jgi:hypothetical protein
MYMVSYDSKMYDLTRTRYIMYCTRVEYGPRIISNKTVINLMPTIYSIWIYMNKEKNYVQVQYKLFKIYCYSYSSFHQHYCTNIPLRWKYQRKVLRLLSDYLIIFILIGKRRNWKKGFFTYRYTNQTQINIFRF